MVITDNGVEKQAIHVPQPRILTRISGTLEALQLRLLEVGREAPGAVVEVFFYGCGHGCEHGRANASAFG